MTLFNHFDLSLRMTRNRMSQLVLSIFEYAVVQNKPDEENKVNTLATMLAHLCHTVASCVKPYDKWDLLNM